VAKAGVERSRLSPESIRAILFSVVHHGDRIMAKLVMKDTKPTNYLILLALFAVLFYLIFLRG
jgi:hypothetical protein